MRKIYLAANWKMNKLNDDVLEFIQNFDSKFIKDRCQIVIAAPFVYLKDLVQWKRDTQNDILIAAQNCHHLESGAFTGEVSAPMLKSIGVDAVILGHSERREYFAESDELIEQKLNRALDNGLTPIYCCGEPLHVRKGNNQNEFIGKQLERSLFNLDIEKMKKVIIAYEPIWAIGTGEVATPEQAESVHLYIRERLSEHYGKDLAEDTSILYGGSMKPSNADNLLVQENVDGGLVGGASLDPESFVSLIKIGEQHQ